MCIRDRLPTADDTIIERVEESIKDLPPVTKMLSDGMTPEEICKKAPVSYTHLDVYKIQAIDILRIHIEGKRNYIDIAGSLTVAEKSSLYTLGTCKKTDSFHTIFG